MKSLENLKVNTYDDRNCYECQLSTIGNWWNDIDIDINLCLLGAWNFSFQGTGTIGERIQIKNNQPEYLKKFFGIEVYKKALIGMEEKYAFIEQELKEGRPVLIRLLSKYIPWDPNLWGNESAFHIVIAKGMNKEEKYLLVSDSYYGKDNQKISFTDFELGAKDKMTGFYFSVPETKIAEKRWEDILKESLKPISEGEETGFTQMRELGKAFRNIQEVKEELLAEKAYVGSVLYMKILGIINSKKQYAIFLRCLSRISKMDILFDIAGKMEIASEMWHKIQLMLVKLSMKKNFDEIAEVADHIEKVIDNEENIYKQLLQLTNEECHEESIYKEKILYSYNIPINSLCDNKAFGPLSTTTKANIFPSLETVPEHERTEYMNQIAFYYEEDFPKNGVVTLDGIDFTLVKPEKSVFDNVLCKGQTIEVEEHDINTIYFVGFSVYGNHSEELKVHYVDGTIQKIVFGLTDWWIKPHFNERAVWQGRSVIWTKGKARIDNNPHYIYGVKLTLKRNSGVKAIELPFCENMHIFSIAVAKAIPTL